MPDNKMYFGTREHMTWIKCPNSGMSRNRVGWGANGTYLNGGGWSRSSSAKHFEPNMTWSFLNHEEVREIEDFYLGAYGDGPLYWLDPFAAKTNVLPAHWSIPRLAQDDAPSLVKGRRPTLTATAANSLNLPTQSAVYQFRDGDQFDSLYIPLPEGYTLHLGAYGSATGTAGLSFSAAGEGVQSSTVLRRNLLTNPSAEATSGTVTVQTNRMTVPYATATGSVAGQWITRGNGVGGTSSYANVTSASDGPVMPDGRTLTRYLRKTWTAGASSAVDIAYAFTPYAITNPITSGFTVTGGQRFCVGTLSRRSWTGGLSRIYVQWRDSTGTIIPGLSSGTDTADAAANSWTWTTVDVTAPANAAYAAVLWQVDYPGALPVGTTLDVAAGYVSDQPRFIAGDQGNGLVDPDLTSAWTGAANSSTSVLRGVAVTGLTATASSTCAAVSSTQWVGSGQRSVRIIPLANSNATSMFLGGTSTSTMNNGMQAGQMYTLIGTCRVSSPQVGSLNSRARRLTVAWSDVAGTGSQQYIDSEEVPNAPGEYQVRLTFTVPSQALWARLFAFNGAAVDGGDVWWDNFALVEGDYLGPYFDGDSGIEKIDAFKSRAYQWEGPVSASTSVLREIFDSVIPVQVPLLAADNNARVTTSVSGVTGVSLSATGVGQLTLTAMTAVILPNGEQPRRGKFLSGAGHSGCQFKSAPAIVGYSSPEAIDYQSVTAEFIEVGSWQ